MGSLHETGNVETRTVALMFHALAAGDLRGQDAHYTLAPRRFAEMLALLVADGHRAISGERWLAGEHGVVLTFDDGHVSNYSVALPQLIAQGMYADFFINPETIGSPGYLTWNQVRELHQHGMSIQSHGYAHRYLTSYSPAALLASLRASRLEIEERIGAPVRLLAPPGGRLPPDLEATALTCGFEAVFTSRPGFLRHMPERRLFPRMSVTADTSDERISRWAGGSMLAVGGQATRYALLAAAKRVLGDRGYERTRAALLRGHGADR